MTLLIQHVPTARQRRLYSPQVLEALDISPHVPPGVRYALITADGAAKPFAFGDLADLAARIHRDRADDALQLTPVRIRCKDGPRAAVQVMATDVGGRTRLIGYAWIAGRPWEALQAALDAADASGGRWQGAA